MGVRKESDIPKTQQDLERERICFKRLYLIKPDIAHSLGIETDKPVFISYHDSTEDRLHTYQVGDIVASSSLDSVESRRVIQGTAIPNVKVLFSRPKFGLSYDETVRGVMTNGCSYWPPSEWVGVVEPLGKSYKESAYLFEYDHITEALKILEIMGFCRMCVRKGVINPLKEGYAVGPWGEGIFTPICDVNKYILDDWMEVFKFQTLSDGQIKFSDFK